MKQKIGITDIRLQVFSILKLHWLVFMMMLASPAAYGDINCVTVGGSYTQSDSISFSPPKPYTVTVPDNLPLNNIDQLYSASQLMQVTAEGADWARIGGFNPYISSTSTIWRVGVAIFWTPDDNGYDNGSHTALEYSLYVPIKCTDASYTIKLVPSSSSVEPWHRKHDTQHLTSNVPFKAIVTDQNGQPKAGIEVTLTSDVTQYSGGHLHDNDRPKGRLISTPEGTPTPVSTLNGTDTLSGTTDSNGEFLFTFGAEEASGEHTITAICNACQNKQATAKEEVEIPGLMLLDSDPLSYDLVGSTDSHPGNHYFSPAALVKIINLAFAYSHDPDFNQLLKINDSSLVKGGTFDVLQNWTSLSDVHGGHRVGIVVDINNYHVPNLLFEEFALRKHIQANWHSKGTGPHYHLLLLGEDN